ncbi:MAG: ParB/RepB/Spo0J family partition protein [Hyphomonadaceae bacterium]|nr:ParB/RepB/Spo0J family partition protein [Hyphomonadaceae bacterium]
MTDIIMIPLTKLVESEDNVRRANRKSGVSELASSIRSHGLLQSIVVRETPQGKFAVIAGGRRLRALRMLAKAGDIEKNAPIPCRVISGDNAAELSLAENIVRQDMAVHEELEAFQRLVDSGEGPEAIAARFGVSPQHVARRLKLARVSPRLIEALKKEDATLDQLAALAIVDDHAAQEKAFFDAPDWARTPERLKTQLCQAHVPESDKLARFVGLGAYQGAGGAIASDLFAEADDDSVRHLVDRDLLVQLAEGKLQPIAARVCGEGWAWVEIAVDGVAWAQFPDRVREQHRVLTAAEEEEREQLYARLDEATDEAEIEAIEAKIDALAVPEWRADEVALAGAVITLSHSGEPKVERGLVKAQDAKALKAIRRQRDKTDACDDAEGGSPPTLKPKPSLPGKLIDELMAHKTLALRAELASQPDLALRCVVFALAANATSDLGPLSLIRVRIDAADVGKLTIRAESTAQAHYNGLLDTWRDRLPSDTGALWSYIATAHVSTLLELLAVLAAPAIELRAGRGEHIADLLCEAAGLDMRKWWQASADSFFEHVRKDVTVNAIMEVNPTLDRAKLDKAAKKDVLARVKKTFKGKGWLPAPLHVPSVPVQANAEVIAAE